MNVRQLEAFHTTMETGSVTRAAEQMGVSQPAVSKLLKSFSDSCGFALFKRSGGRMLPTREARIMAAEVEKMFSGTQRVARLAAAVRNREWGDVTLAAPAALATRWLGEALAPLLREEPDLHVTLQSRSSPQIAELVAAQQIDIGLSVLPVDRPDVRAEIVMRFAMVCILPAGHYLTARQSVAIDDLRDEPFISLARGDCSLMTIERAFQMSGVQKRHRIEVPLSETACSFVASGAGVSIVPPFVGLDYGEDKLVRRNLLPKTFMDVWMLTSASRPPSLAAARMVEELRIVSASFDQR